MIRAAIRDDHTAHARLEIFRRHSACLTCKPPGFSPGQFHVRLMLKGLVRVKSVKEICKIALLALALSAAATALFLGIAVALMN